MLHFLRRQFTRVLRSRGLLLLKRPSDHPEPLRLYLQELKLSGFAPRAICCFDTDIHLQNDVLDCFTRTRVTFAAAPAGLEAKSAGEGDTPDLVEFDLETCQPEAISRTASSLFEAPIILLRASLRYFWEKQGDLTAIDRWMKQRGYELFDLYEYGRLSLLRAPADQVIFAFEKAGRRVDLPRSRHERTSRVAQAFVFLSPAIAQANEVTRLGGPGSFGFAAGVLNPGVIESGDEIWLLVRGEREPWAVLRNDEKAFLASCVPLLLRLDSHLQLRGAENLEAPPDLESHRAKAEDFRLYRYQGELYVNHSIISVSPRKSGAEHAVDVDRMKSRVGISRFDSESKRLEFLGVPTLDCPLAPQEKNWAFFSQGEDLYLIYSFLPYRVLRLSDWSKLEFETVLDIPLQSALAVDGVQIRNSANPVGYDEQHLLFLIHKVYPVKEYVFWAVLIDRNTLQPCAISERPLLRAGASAPVSILYACSLLVRSTEVIVFGGLNDCSFGYWRIPRERLDQAWVSLSGGPFAFPARTPTATAFSEN